MTKTTIIEQELKKIEGYLLSIQRDTINGWYFLEVGIPSSWISDSNKEIECETIAENDNYKLLKIVPKKRTIIVDDLLLFVIKIMQVNEQIAKKEKEFTSKMESMKKSLEKEAEKFYSDLEKLKQNSFEKLFDGDNEDETPSITNTPKKKGRPSKNIIEETKGEETVSEQ